MQDKGSRFVVISNDEYFEKVNTQIGRSSFIQLPHDITKSFENKVTVILRNGKKWGVLDKKWTNYIKCNYCKPGTIYGLIKTHKENNPVRVITSWCDTAIEYLSTFVEKHLYKEVYKINRL